MAAASYTTDLATFNLMEALPTVGEAAGYVNSGSAVAETDFPVQGTGCLSATMTKTGLGSIMADFGSNITWTSGWSFFVWGVFLPANAVNTDALGGLRIIVGPDLNNFRAWYVGGRDFGRYPYGGWQNFVVDPEVTAQSTVGTPGTAYRWLGLGVDCTSAIARGNPIGLDAVRYGRGEMRINGGDLANGYATFAAAATTNDNSSNRWGLIQEQSGSYLWKGLMVLGYTSAVDFRDSNRVVTVDNTRRVQPAFNRIEVRQATSRIDWTNISITALGTVSKGQFAAIDNADINLESCTFTDMDTFVFLSNSTINGSTFRRCGQITQNAAIFSSCIFDNSTAAVCMLVSDLDNITNSDFVSDGTGHAIELTAAHAGGTFSLSGVNFTGYAATNGSTGNEAIYNNSGGAVIINVTGGTTPTIRNGTGASTTVVAGAVTVEVTTSTTSGTAIQSARVFLKAAAGGPFPAAASVSIANSGTTATVTHTSHGLSTGDKVVIKGASHTANNGVWTITVTGTNTYTYTMGSSPGSNPTGTITSTFVFLYGLTDATGKISMSRVVPSSQPIIGWARKSSTAPFFKEGALSGTVSNSAGASITAVLVSDE